MTRSDERSLKLIFIKNRKKKKKKNVDLYRQASVQLSSVQFKRVSMRSGRSICAPPRVSGVSLMLPLKQFQCWSDCMTMALFLMSSQGRSLSASSSYAFHLQAISAHRPQVGQSSGGHSDSPSRLCLWLVSAPGRTVKWRTQ